MSLKHIAIIMDGNGRWAKKRHLPRLLGHRAGVKAVERTVRAAADFGIPYLSLYAFSTENWKRPKTEVKGLMSLFRYYINKKVQELVKEDVRLRFAGRTKELPKDIQEIIHEAENETEKGQRLQLMLLKDGYKGKVTEETIRSYLYLPDLPDPDLIIRTSGEYRLSNFWLWEGSYSEFYFSSLLWPDFNKEALQEAILSYEKRDRRYGGIQR